MPVTQCIYKWPVSLPRGHMLRPGPGPGERGRGRCDLPGQYPASASSCHLSYRSFGAVCFVKLWKSFLEINHLNYVFISGNLPSIHVEKLCWKKIAESIVLQEDYNTFLNVGFYMKRLYLRSRYNLPFMKIHLKLCQNDDPDTIGWSMI